MANYQKELDGGSKITADQVKKNRSRPVSPSTGPQKIETAYQTRFVATDIR